MIHVALIQEEFVRKPCGTTTKLQIILQPLPLPGGQLFDLGREQRIACREISDSTH